MIVNNVEKSAVPLCCSEKNEHHTAADIILLCIRTTLITDAHVAYWCLVTITYWAKLRATVFSIVWKKHISHLIIEMIEYKIGHTHK